MANSKRKCAYCKERKPTETMIIRGAQAFCNKDHYIEYAAGNVKKLAAKGRKQQDKAFNQKKRNFQANDMKLRRKMAVMYFNKFIRLRDALEPCISCKRVNATQFHAGHYKPAGINSALKFNELNVHKQCSQCNEKLSGNLTNYRINLIEKIGLDKVEELENNKAITRYTCEQLKQIEDAYKFKCNQLEKDLAA